MRVIKTLSAALQETGDTEVTRRTLEYIFEYLHHNCYLLKSKDGKCELIKLQSSTSPPSARKTLKHKLIRNPKTMRVMNCVIKPFKQSETKEYDRLFSEMQNIPNGMWILNLSDAVMLRKDRRIPWPILGSGSLPEKFHGPMLRILAGSGREGFEDVAIPNYDDVRVAMGYDSIPEAEMSWDKKDEKVVFRGSSTGCGITPETNMRLKVSKLDFPWLDAGITTLTKNPKYDPVHGIGVIKAEDAKKVPRMSFGEQSKHKFILNIDGNVAAFRLLTWMQTGSVIMNVKSEYTLWFSDKLKHRKNIIEIKADLSDLEEQYNWCLKNDSKCQKIAKAGLDLSRKLLTKPIVTEFFKTEFF
jgi:Glycosyl transferase family 90